MKPGYLLIAFALGILLGIYLSSHHGVTFDNFSNELDSLRKSAKSHEIQKQVFESLAAKKDKEKIVAEAKAYNQEQRAIKAEQRASLLEAKFRNLPKPKTKADSIVYFPIAVIKCDSALTAADSAKNEFKRALTDTKGALKKANEELSDKSNALVQSNLENWKLTKMDTIHIQREKFLEKKVRKAYGIGGAIGVILTLILIAL